MNQKQDRKKEAFQPHAQLFVDALDKAMRSSDGVWVNSQSATAPNLYMRQNKVSAYSSLLMAVHSQMRGCALNTYISYSDAVNKNIRFGDYNGGVQIPYVRQDGYRNRLSNRLITDAEYKALEPSEAVSYRPNFQRFLRMVYNIDQTNFKQTNAEAYNALLKGDGPEKARGVNSLEKECDDLTDFDDNLALYERHMVGLMPTEEERTHYDPDADTVVMACLNSYPSTDAFLQDGYRAIAAATGHSSRLDRNTSTEQDVLYEKLVQESLSAMRMAQMGRPGAISEENRPLIPKWMDMLTQNPRLMLNLERDVNLANEMLIRAEANEKVMTLFKPKPQVKEMPIEDMLALKDIIRHGGMVTNAINYSSPEAYKAMLEKYGLGELHQKIEQCHSVLRDNESLREKGRISEESYIQTKSDMYKELSKLGSEMSENIVSIIPRPWDYYGRRYISNEVERLVLDERKELVLVHDPETKIVNVLLPTDARTGGTVTTATGEKVDFWLDPLEQLTPAELEGATITKADPEWCDKEKVAQSIMENEGAKYVRFFETQGALGFYPPNDYYMGKEMTAAKVIDREKASYFLTYDIKSIVHDTCAMDFDNVSVIKDDNGAWAMNMQTSSGENISVYPLPADLKIYFEQCRDLTEDSLATKKELAQKYYNLVLEDPRLNVDLFYKVPEGINPDCIERVYIYKDPRFGVQMMKPNIRGLENVKPRPVSRSQFQKLWIAPDIDRYRKALACRIFADVIPLQYSNESKIDRHLLDQMQKETFVGLIVTPSGAKIPVHDLSRLNTPETNRNFSKDNNPRTGYVQIDRQPFAQGQNQSENSSKNQTKEQAPYQSMSERGSKSADQNTSNTEGQNKPKYQASEQGTSMSSSAAEGKSQQTKVQSTASKPEQPNLFTEADKPQNVGQSTAQKGGETKSRTPASYSQTNSKQEGNNKVKEPAASYYAPTLEAPNPLENEANKNIVSASEAEQENIADVTVSVELLNQYNKLRGMYPDAFIVISEEGRAKALNDNAFQAFDIIQDGHPLGFAQHPLSESPKDKIPVFEMSESQFEGELKNIMKRNTSVIFCRLEDEVEADREKEQGLRMSM